MKKYFDVTGGLAGRLTHGRRLVKAVDDVSFDVPSGSTLALVGESGSGKSTTARLIARLLPATDGEVYFAGQDVLKMAPGHLKRIRKEVQVVFQDPFSSLNPRMRVEEIVGRSLTIHFGLKGRRRRERVSELLQQVGLTGDHLDRFPHEFSGGQRQRVAIARALASEPALLLADEAVSALDVSVQAQILELLQDLRTRLHLTMIFITHDLNVAEFVADEIAVLYAGKIAEIGPVEEVFERPLHPYTQSLLEARPRFGRADAAQPLSGEPALPMNPPPGCRFAHRCPIKGDACYKGDIPLVSKGCAHLVACIKV